MTDIPVDWRCPVCEGINHGGRVCSTCGETLPPGFVPEAATRRRPPAPTSATAPRVVAAPRPPRLPSPEEVFGSNPFR